MFAVLKTGGKQYRVQAGDVLRVERIAADAGEKVQFNEVLMLGGDRLTIGAPMVAGAAVQAEVIDQVKADKVITYHKRRRKHSSQRTRGHRQGLTLLRVTDILASGADKSGVKAAIGTGSVPKSERPAKATGPKAGPTGPVKGAKAAKAAAKAAPVKAAAPKAEKAAPAKVAAPKAAKAEKPAAAPKVAKADAAPKVAKADAAPKAAKAAAPKAEKAAKTEAAPAKPKRAAKKSDPKE